MLNGLDSGSRCRGYLGVICLAEHTMKFQQGVVCVEKYLLLVSLLTQYLLLTLREQSPADGKKGTQHQVHQLQ